MEMRLLGSKNEQIKLKGLLSHTAMPPISHLWTNKSQRVKDLEKKYHKIFSHKHSISYCDIISTWHMNKLCDTSVSDIY